MVDTVGSQHLLNSDQITDQVGLVSCRKLRRNWSNLSYTQTVPCPLLDLLKQDIYLSVGDNISQGI